jgi:multidrug efflux pump subunit AcrA (membrane-fusion protein)
MTRFHYALIVAICSWADMVGGGELKLPATAVPKTARLHLSHCLVSLIDDVEVPAEKAGVLRKLAAREGSYLEAGAPLAWIDDVQAKDTLAAARADHDAAQARAHSDLEIEYAVATHRTAEAEYNIAQTANAQTPNTVALVEVEKLRLAAEQARIKIGVSRFEHDVLGIEAGGFAAKVRLAESDLTRHGIVAPLAGEVVETFFREGEWIEPGKPVVRLVRLDRLRVEGFVKFDELAPADVIGRPVRAVIKIAGNRTQTFTGKVTFVNPLVEPGGEYRVWAEVDNRRERGQWQLRPGLEADVAVLIGTDELRR